MACALTLLASASELRGRLVAFCTYEAELLTTTVRPDARSQTTTPTSPLRRGMRIKPVAAWPRSASGFARNCANCYQLCHLCIAAGMDRVKHASRIRRIRKLNTQLKQLFPKAVLELRFSNPWELLVATILSAQCTDKLVNKITSELFANYATLDDYVHAADTAATISEFERAIKPSGFYHAKARHILEAAKTIKGRFDGKVPNTMQDLVTIPGVARKTANVVLAASYDVISGVIVDTHVIRFVRRYDLSDFKDPLRIERDLMELLPKEEWRGFALRVTLYGRYLAPARPYDTSKDPLVKVYPPAAKCFGSRSRKRATKVQ